MLVELTAERLEDCVAAYVETFAGPPWLETWSTDDARQRLSDLLRTPRSLGVCEVDDADDVDHGHRLVGFAVGHLERARGGDQFLLQEMCVRPAHQRAGIGTLLLTAIADRLPETSSWYLLTARDTPAASFYQRHGFRPAGRMGVFVRP